MAEESKPRRRPKNKYVSRSNAICVTVYDPTGRPLDEEVAEACANSVLQVALENKLLIGLART